MAMRWFIKAIGCVFFIIGNLIFFDTCLADANEDQAEQRVLCEPFYPYQPYYPFPPPCQPCNDPPCWQSAEIYCAWTIEVDFLYWQTTVGGLPFAGVFKFSNFEIPTEKSLKQVDFGFRPGFRLWLSREFACDWDLRGYWTRLHTFGKKSESGFIFPVWFFVPAQANFIDAHQNLHYDVVNVDCVKHFCIGDCFAFSPFAGLVAAIINQRLKTESTLIVEGFGSQKTKVINDFAGGGFQLGLEAKYSLCRWINAYVRGAYDLLYGIFTLKKKDFVEIPALEGGVAGTEKSHERGVVSGFNLDIGLTSCWRACGYGFEAHIGYEFVYWPSQTRVHQIIPADGFTAPVLGHGDIGFQGLNVGLNLYF